MYFFTILYKGFVNAVVEVDDMKHGMHTVHIKQWLHFRMNAQRALRGIVAKYPVGSLMAFKASLSLRRPSVRVNIAPLRAQKLWPGGWRLAVN